MDSTLDHAERYVPGMRERVLHARPRHQPDARSIPVA